MRTSDSSAATVVVRCRQPRSPPVAVAAGHRRFIVASVPVVENGKPVGWSVTYSRAGGTKTTYAICAS